MDVKPKITPVQHGGNLSGLVRLHPHAPRPLIDLSTGINPYAYPLPPARTEYRHRLADSDDMQTAFTACAKHYAVSNPDSITLASGMQSLMFALAALRIKKHGSSNVAILSPTYAEHQRVWHAVGHRIMPIDGIESADQFDVVILCNPNNPDGRTTTPQELLDLAARLKIRGGWLIVDESFAELMHGISLTHHVSEHDNIAVLRSCGKFFGIAGLRVSLAIAPLQWAQWLRTSTGPWPISTYVCHFLPAMLGNITWATQMREQLETEAAHWREILSRHFTIIGHTALFTLVESDEASTWYDNLAAQGILVRKFPYNRQWLRFGLPDQSHLKRLEAALAVMNL